MKNCDTYKRRRPGLILALVCLIAALAAAPAAAGNKYWVDGTSWWDYSSYWSATPGGPGGAGQPQNGDNVYLTQSDALNRTVYYYNTLYPSAVLNYLTIDATGSGTMTLNQGYGSYNHPLAAQYEDVGWAGHGTFKQSSGTNTVSNLLTLGYGTSASGSYELSGTGSLAANNQIIGHWGSGTFTQSGGTNTVTSSLELGSSSDSSGTYELSGSGSLSAGSESIGYWGSGTFTQSGGTNKVNDTLTIAANSGSSGTYNLQDGSLTAGTVNLNTGGTFKQTGGTLKSTTFNQQGGTVTGYLQNQGVFNYYSGLFSGRLDNYGTANLYAGGNSSFTAENGLNQYSATPLNIASGKALTLNGFGLVVGQGGVMTLSGTLAAQNEDVGVFGHGTFTQSGGTNTVSNALVLGDNLGASGTYNLSGTGSLSAENQFIGYDASGTFTQSGGTNKVSDSLYLGNGYGSSGSYELSGSSSLKANNQFIGYDGSGTFTQSGGTNNVTNTLTLSANPGFSTGIYNLQDGSLSAGTVILNGGGTFNQTGGTLNAATFNQSGGTVTGYLQNQGGFNYYGGLFSGRLYNYGTANLYAGGNTEFTAGNGLANYTDLTIGAGRAVILNGNGLDNSGTLTMGGGTLKGSGPLVNNAYLTGYGTIAGNAGFTNYGFVTQSGGTLALNNTGSNANYGNFDLATGNLFTLGSGATLTNEGSLNLNSAVITGAGTLNNTNGGTIYGRGTIASNFANNSGGLLVVADGTTNITQPFSNSGAVQLTSYTANLAGGFLTNSGTIEGRGQVGNNVFNSGIIEAIGGTLTLGGLVTNNAGGLMTAGAGNKLLVSGGLSPNVGVINLTGGTFDNNNKPLSNNNQISGYGTFRTGGLSNAGTMTLSGGTTTVNGDVTNQGAGHLNIAYNPAIFTGNVTNSGQVKVTSTTVTWAGSFTNSGGYTSDPAVNHFNDNLVVESTGYLSGGIGDSFNLGKDFINHSTEKTSWNTTQALLTFGGQGGTTQHQLDIPGADLGKSMAGYTDNFAWGTLDLTGQSLTVNDGNTNTSGGGFYVGKILGLTIDLDQMMVTDITGSSGLNIYYDLALNPDLHGWTYDLTGGGQLIASAPVPLPASAWLFLSGLAGLGLLRRREGK